MAKKTASSKSTRVKISDSRAGRLYRMLKALSTNNSSRSSLLKKLKVGMRTFYRDVDLLRACQIPIETIDEGYSLNESLDDALSRLPFPDPELTFGDVVTLMKGRTTSHQKLKRIFESLSK